MTVDGKIDISNTENVKPNVINISQLLNAINTLNNKLELLNIKIQQNISNIDLLHKAFELSEKNIKFIEKKLSE